MSPSMKMVEMYYTENGLPIDMDKEWEFAKRYEMGEDRARNTTGSSRKGRGCSTCT